MTSTQYLYQNYFVINNNMALYAFHILDINVYSFSSEKNVLVKRSCIAKLQRRKSFYTLRNESAKSNWISTSVSERWIENVEMPFNVMNQLWSITLFHHKKLVVNIVRTCFLFFWTTFKGSANFIFNTKRIRIVKSFID